ncbi:membrane-associated protease RseP (regulator of RpoE activity) [Kitasatospora sp. MAP12-15]|uniref:M50 family metallopeptidase n=1 Tax=unclassified Kitasatospora TaxID=2633591 RepID=UPI0024739C02|nr:site-2 protease family protein [Kitasatospora sp. MAP12-44]MDH6113166.1 membrane-associated protease RseP (regulator of RpoE activity) [Kitasatospora sp. MAP12-44]
MTAVMTVLGIVVFVLGLLISIAWHELGHLSTAKLFGIRVPQYMVGFGPTIWSRKKGDTEYGFKAIPLGGYIRMIGMFPPGADGRITKRSSSPWRSMIEDAREASYEELLPGDEDRLFYKRKPWKRVIVMFAGPFMNLILAFGLFLVAMMGFGVQQSMPTVSVVSQCVLPVSQAGQNCKPDSPPSPAEAAGLKKGDTIVSFGGDRIHTYQQLQDDIRKSAGQTVPIVVRRDGAQVPLSAAIQTNVLSKVDANGYPIPNQTVTAGFLGIEPTTGVVQLGFGDSVSRMSDMADTGLHSLVALPGKIPALWGSVFEGKPRTADQPIGMVGAARIGGEVASMHLPASQRIAFMVNLLAGINLSLFLFNMLPLLPLDGGHVAGALWESLRRHTARLVKRPDPGPFDVAKLMPLAYVVASIFIGFTLLVLAADLINPVKIS